MAAGPLVVTYPLTSDSTTYDAVHVAKPGLGPREGPKDRIPLRLSKHVTGEEFGFRRVRNIFPDM